MSVTVMNTAPSVGSDTPAAACALPNAVGKSCRDPHHLAGALHLRAQHSVGAGEAGEGEHRLLDADVLPPPLAAGPGSDSRSPEHQPAGQLGERRADRLGDERNRARGARIGLDHVQLAPRDPVLDVDQADDT